MLDLSPRTEWLILGAILTYFVGWTYLSEYLGFFGLTVAGVDVPLQYYFVYAVAPLWSWWGTWGLVGLGLSAATLVLVALVVIAAKEDPPALRILRAGLAIIVAVLAFWLARDRAVSDALVQARGGVGRPITITFKSNVRELLATTDPVLIDANNARELRLIWQDSRSIYVVQSHRDFGRVQDNQGRTVFAAYRIPLSSVETSSQYALPYRGNEE